VKHSAAADNDGDRSAVARGSVSARALVPLGVLVFLAVLFFAPFGLTWPCPLKTLSGIPCPTCGMTRAARLVAHGDFGAATHMHPLWFVVLPLVVLAGLVEVAGYLRTGAWGAAGKVRALRYAGYVAAVLLVLVWVARFLGAFGGPVR
jgi:hypothetical protein